jgi:hypothetical protein
MTYDQKLTALKNWIKRRSYFRAITADEIIDEIRRRWPLTTETDIERLYQDS